MSSSTHPHWQDSSVFTCQLTRGERQKWVHGLWRFLEWLSLSPIDYKFKDSPALGSTLSSLALDDQAATSCCSHFSSLAFLLFLLLLGRHLPPRAVVAGSAAPRTGTSIPFSPLLPSPIESIYRVTATTKEWTELTSGASLCLWMKLCDLDNSAAEQVDPTEFRNSDREFLVQVTERRVMEGKIRAEWEKSLFFPPHSMKDSLHFLGGGPNFPSPNDLMDWNAFPRANPRCWNSVESRDFRPSLTLTWIQEGFFFSSFLFFLPAKPLRLCVVLPNSNKSPDFPAEKRRRRGLVARPAWPAWGESQPRPESTALCARFLTLFRPAFGPVNRR